MKTILEIFYLRMSGTRVRYQRKKISLSRKGSNPDQRIWVNIRDEQRESSEQQEFIVHSTSWRYERPDKVLLTYAAYSDELTFEKGKSKSIPLQDLRVIRTKSCKPRSQAELEKKLVSHAMRHIAFLIKTDNEIDFKSSMTPETIEKFEKLWVNLAGKVF